MSFPANSKHFATLLHAMSLLASMYLRIKSLWMCRWVTCHRKIILKQFRRPSPTFCKASKQSKYKGLQSQVYPFEDSSTNDPTCLGLDHTKSEERSQQIWAECLCCQGCEWLALCVPYSCRPSASHSKAALQHGESRAVSLLVVTHITENSSIEESAFSRRKQSAAMSHSCSQLQFLTSYRQALYSIVSMPLLRWCCCCQAANLHFS